MAIRQVEVDDYGKLDHVEQGKLIVKEFAGNTILIIRNSDGTQSRADVLWRDLERAWQAVKGY